MSENISQTFEGRAAQMKQAQLHEKMTDEYQVLAGVIREKYPKESIQHGLRKFKPYAADFPNESLSLCCSIIDMNKLQDVLYEVVDIMMEIPKFNDENRVQYFIRKVEGLIDEGRCLDPYVKQCVNDLKHKLQDTNASPAASL